MSFVPGDETVADGTMSKAIYDAMIAMFGANAQIDQARKEAAAAMAIGICEHANPRLLSGDVSGPDVSTDNAIPRWDGTAGGAIQDSLVTIDDSGNIALASGKTVDGRDVSADGSTLDAHVGSSANPHSVTASQVGAVPTSRIIAASSPLRVNGGPSSTLAANMTLSIGQASEAGAGSMSAADFSKLAGIVSGVYVPVPIIDTGLSSIDAVFTHYFRRSGSIVGVSGGCNVTPSAAGVFRLRLPIPVATTFASGDVDGRSAISSGGSSWIGGITFGDSTTGDMIVSGRVSGTAALGIGYSFQYEVK